MKHTSKVCRGMVFWYNPIRAITRGNPQIKEADIKPNGSLEFKERPHVVVSNNAGNFSSTTLNLLPITTRNEATLPCHVKYVYQGKPQVIMAEQPVTANIADLTGYICTLSPEVMEQVDEAIRVQFAVHEPLSDALVNLERRLSAMVTRVIQAANTQKNAQAATVALTNSAIEDIALNLAEQVEGLLGDMTPPPSAVVGAAESTLVPPVEEVPTTASTAPKSNSGSSREPAEWTMPPEKPKQPEKKPKTKGTKTKKQQKSTPQQTSSDGTAMQRKKPGKASKYSVEFMVKYLRDFDIYPPRMMCDRYGINDRKALYPKKYYFINKLTEMGINYKTYELPTKEGENK